MNLEDLRAYYLSLPEVEESFPFGEDPLVLKTRGKMFAYISLNRGNESYIALKCDPERAIELREHYPDAIEPAYHMNKIHWNGLHLSRGLSPTLIRELVLHSYELVCQKLPKS